MTDMNITCFDDLLRMSRAQSEPQRLLFVFAAAELPDDSTQEQQRNFSAGAGGALVPRMCVDKTPDELDTFARLVEESRAAGAEWAIVFVAALSGRSGIAPTHTDAKAPLDRMVSAIEAGQLGSLLPFDRGGMPVVLD